MKFSVVLFTSDRGITPARAAQAAEDRGFHAIYVPEHTHIPTSRDTAHPTTGDATLPDDRYLRTLDPWVALATAASVTSRIRLGTAVALPVEHDPICLAKTIASLDHLSGGRVVIGAGFGWNEEEMRDHGVPVEKRRTLMRECFEAMGRLWTDEVASYEGDLVRFGPSWSGPKPIQQPRPPLLLGGGSTATVFNWIARSADGWLTTPYEADVAGAVGRLRRTWTDAGRSGQPYVVSLLAARVDDESVAAWRAAGVDEIAIGLPDKSEDEVLAYIDRRAGLLERHGSA
jgi:probable F420-dependent oxidoreductase